MNKMNKNKRIIDCSIGEILDLGKQLIDYYCSKELYEIREQPKVTTAPNTVEYYIPNPKRNDYRPQFKEGDIICQSQTEL